VKLNGTLLSRDIISTLPGDLFLTQCHDARHKNAVWHTLFIACLASSHHNCDEPGINHELWWAGSHLAGTNERKRQGLFEEIPRPKFLLSVAVRAISVRIICDYKVNIDPHRSLARGIIGVLNG
jgi:hypothetical protein